MWKKNVSCNPSTPWSSAGKLIDVGEIISRGWYLGTKNSGEIEGWEYKEDGVIFVTCFVTMNNLRAFSKSMSK